MSDKSWKAFERRCARDVGVERIPVTGERHGADAEDGMFCYQFKLGRKMPSYLRDWLAGIRGAGARRRPEKTGIVVWKPKGALDADAVVLVAWADWVQLHGPTPPVEAEQVAARSNAPRAARSPGGPRCLYRKTPGLALRVTLLAPLRERAVCLPTRP